MNLAYLIGQGGGGNLIIDQATVDGHPEVHLYLGREEKVLVFSPEEARAVAAALMIAAETPR